MEVKLQMGWPVGVADHVGGYLLGLLEIAMDLNLVRLQDPK